MYKTLWKEEKGDCIVGVFGGELLVCMIALFVRTLSYPKLLSKAVSRPHAMLRSECPYTLEQIANIDRFQFKSTLDIFTSMLCFNQNDIESIWSKYFATIIPYRILLNKICFWPYKESSSSNAVIANTKLGRFGIIQECVYWKKQ